MKILKCIEPGQLQYEEAPFPTLEDGRVILKVRRIGICGTDIHAFEGTQPYFTYPRILGHEIAAEIAACGSDSEFAVGDIVTVIPYFNCGTCVACRSDRPNCCVNLNVCGVHVDGAMREFISVPETHIVPGRGLPTDILALVEPFSIGVHGVRRAGIEPGEFVLVVGAGPIGMTAMEIARIEGANVIAMDVNDSRLDFCKQKIQVANTVNPAKSNVNQFLSELTSGDMPSVIIDATGSLTAINNSFALMAHGARYILIGLQKGQISINHPEFHKREATLMSSRNAVRDDFDFVIQNIKAGKLRASEYITHRVEFAKLREQFMSICDPASHVVKTVVTMD
jgi:2-desacetyl-2-hydroxyethyl bacteriochlorophyllide A dehydrogenase